MSRHGMFITIEGPDGVGKSTQAGLLVSWLRSLNRPTVGTFEPGDTPAGARMRQVLLDPGVELCPRAEALLMAADRAQHVAEVIVPALEQGTHVVCDRFVHSSIAYQSAGRGLPEAEVVELSRFAAGTLVDPDLVIRLSLDDEQRRSRLAGRGGDPDRFEQADGGFADRVTASYRHPTKIGLRVVDVDASGSMWEVAGRIRDVVSDVLWLWDAAPAWCLESARVPMLGLVRRPPMLYVSMLGCFSKTVGRRVRDEERGFVGAEDGTGFWWIRHDDVWLFAGLNNSRACGDRPTLWGECVTQPIGARDRRNAVDAEIPEGSGVRGSVPFTEWEKRVQETMGSRR